MTWNKMVQPDIKKTSRREERAHKKLKNKVCIKKGEIGDVLFIDNPHPTPKICVLI
jgi:hypothetical protein